MQEKRVDRKGLGTETGTSGVRKVGTASNSDGICQPHGGSMLPAELRHAPDEDVYSRLIIPKAVKIPRGATVG